jgi:hypothetical protein
MPELVRDFLDPAEFFRQVKTICGIDFFCGVPDSLLKGIFSSFFITQCTLIRFRFLCVCDKKCSVLSSYYYREWRFCYWSCLRFLYGHWTTIVSLFTSNSSSFYLDMFRFIFRILVLEILLIQSCLLLHLVFIVYQCYY